MTHVENNVTIWELEDGWRDESSEGPYTETLQTLGCWSISRLHEYYRRGHDNLYKLEFKNKLVRKFKTIESAKSYVEEQSGE